MDCTKVDDIKVEMPGDDDNKSAGEGNPAGHQGNCEAGGQHQCSLSTVNFYVKPHARVQPLSEQLRYNTSAVLQCFPMVLGDHYYGPRDCL